MVKNIVEFIYVIIAAFMYVAFGYAEAVLTLAAIIAVELSVRAYLIFKK